MSNQLYIIEARHGNDLALGALQPESYFGPCAISGMTTDQMAKAIFSTRPDAVLSGDTIPLWPRIIHPLWTARRKTW